MIRVFGIDLAEGYWWSEAQTGIQPKDEEIEQALEPYRVEEQAP